MATEVTVDRQGRVVIPLRERERLGVASGGVLELASTPEGILLERRRRAVVRKAADGAPEVTIEELEDVSNEDALEGIRQARERE